jgi:hypothetical protein
LVLDWGTREPPASAFKIEAPSVQDITPIADLRKAMRLVVAKNKRPGSIRAESNVAETRFKRC